MVNPIKTVVKCCGCIVLTQLIGILVSLGALVAFVLVFYLYIVPWGEDQIREALHLGQNVDIGSLNASFIAANNCSGCVFGVNTDWPTNTTGTLHFLDTSAGSTASGVIATSLAAGAAAGISSMLWASFFPSAASVLSFSSGFYEMTHIIEQAQFISMISQLQIDGAPVFLHQFSREMAWTNFNVPKAITDTLKTTRRLHDAGESHYHHRQLETSLLSTTASGETGPKRYAALIGVAPQRLFFYTLLSFALVIAAIHVLYVLGVVVMSMCSKKDSVGTVAATLYRKVVWACLLALLLAQYIFSMAGSYYIYQNADAGDSGRDTYFVWGAIGLVAIVGFAIVFGVLIISSNRDELRDLGTYEHDQRPFAAKYGAYYDEYNFDNRFFFVPRILLAVSTGAVVGVIQDATTQLLCILGLTLVYLVLLLAREPHLLRFLYYIGIASVFLKVVLVCMMLMLVQDDFFPQEVRDNVAYGIIGVNMFIFFLLFLRQAYTIIHKIIRGCKNKDRARASSSDSDAGRHRDVINLEHGNAGAAARNPPYARMESSTALNDKNASSASNQQQPQGFSNQQGQLAYRNNNNNNNAPLQHQQSSYTQPFARDSVGFGGVQRSPYEREVGGASANAGAARAGAAKTAGQAPRNAPNEYGRYDARAQQSPSQPHPNNNKNNNMAAAAAGGVAFGAALGATAAMRDRKDECADEYVTAKSAASPVRNRTSMARDADPSDRFAASSPTPYQALTSANQFGKPLRKTSIDLDDMEDDDVVAPPPVYSSASGAAPSHSHSHMQQEAPSSGREPPRVRQSYLRFTDSDMSSYDDDIDGRSPRSVASSSAGAVRAPPASTTSVSSDFSVDSTATDWFDRRSKTEIEDADSSVAGDASIAAGAGATRMSAFALRGSTDSYTTDFGTNRTLSSAPSDASAGDSSSAFDTDRSMNTVGFSFDDDDSSRDVDIDVDEHHGLGPSAAGAAYDTEYAGSGRSLETLENSASRASVAAYLHGESGVHSDDSDTDDAYRSSGSYARANANDSFLSAISARSDEGAQFYIDGQRRNTNSPVASATGVDGAELQQRPRPKKL